MCGEHPIFDHWQARATGSSPHVRGARGCQQLQQSYLGIIPACAGSTSMNGLMTCPRRDHPRMCGEHQCMFPGQVPRRGSSPHVRGALQLRGSRTDARGIIPACAGSTGVVLMRFFFLTGSSPHVRGARKDSPLRRCHSGIIPACAGSTSSSTLAAVLSRDHPRMCGEHIILTPPTILRAGSSPHVRGALNTWRWNNPLSGIIPACAGSTR